MKGYIYILPAIIIVLSGCQKLKKESKQLSPVPVEIIVVGTCNDATTRHYVGEIEAASEVPIHHQLGGQIVALYVQNGDYVKAGQLIAEVDSTQIKSLHDIALATLQQAQDAYARLENMHKEGGISEVKWVEMKTNLEKAIQQEISTRKSLQDCHLLAPAPGVVSGMNMHIGQTLLPTQNICSIIDTRSLCASFTVPEQEISELEKGTSITAEVPAIRKYFEGTIIEKSISAGALAHTYKVKARLKSDNTALLPGMVAKVGIQKSETKGLVVPANCIQTTQQGAAVWIIQNGKAERISITTSEFIKNGVLVTQGIALGDTIVTAGYQKLYNGASITFIENK